MEFSYFSLNKSQRKEGEKTVSSSLSTLSDSDSAVSFFSDEQCVVSVTCKVENELQPQCRQHPLPVKHLRLQFAFPGGPELPGQGGWRKSRTSQVLTEAGIVPTGEGRWGWGTPDVQTVHIHVHKESWDSPSSSITITSPSKPLLHT